MAKARSLPLLIGSALSALALAAPAEAGRVFFVDFANGNNGNSGMSSGSPWKHAPGDPAATGGPATVRLQPGDVIRFRGGVSYRGTITLRASGQAGAPIVYSGTGFGSGNAIFDGADPVTSAVPCPSAAACGGASNWQSLWLVSYAEPAIRHQQLFDNRGPLFEAVSPQPADPFFGNDTSGFVPIPVAQLAALRAGRLEQAQLADAARGQPNARLLVWVQPNTVEERPILSVSGATILFDATGLDFYTNRDTLAAVIGSLRGVTRAGSYARIGAGRAVVFPRGGTGYFIGSGRRGFNLNGQSHVVIRGFHLLRGTASEGTTNREGLGIVDVSGTARQILIEDNRFAQASLRNGYGAIHLNRVEGLVIRRNRLEELMWGSGIRLGAGVRQAVIEDNRLSRGGRTGIYTGGAQDVVIRRNIVSGYMGPHGNAISAYAASQRVHILGNCVFGSARPLTLSGSSSMAGAHDHRVHGNILVADPQGTAALHSWGTIIGLDIRDNLMLGRRRGAILDSRDKAVTAIGNRTSGGITASKTIPADWTLANNTSNVDYDQARAEAQLSNTQCAAHGPKGTISVAPSGDAGSQLSGPTVGTQPAPLQWTGF